MPNPIRLLERAVLALERIAHIMAQINADELVAEITKFTTVFTKFSADLNDFLTKLPVTDPAVQNKIDTAVAALKGFELIANDLDAKVNPPVVPVQP